MTLMIQPDPTWDTNYLLAVILSHTREGERVQFLTDTQAAPSLVQRLRVALSRSRKRHKAQGKKVVEFTLRHEIYPYTDESGKRHSAVVMWTERQPHHVTREILDDIMER